MADQEENLEQQEETTAESTEDAAEGSAAQSEREAVSEAASSEAEAAGPTEAEAAPPAESESEAAAAPQPEAEVTAAPAAAEESAAEPEAAPAEPEGEKEALTFEVLHKKTVAELRDVAQGLEHAALAGYSTMHKEQLVPALCEALGIEAHVHHEVVGIDKDKVKARIRELKVQRAQAIEAGDRAQLKLARSRIKSLKRKIRRATV